jgi:hypothetical protein
MNPDKQCPGLIHVAEVRQIRISGELIESDIVAGLSFQGGCNSPFPVLVRLTTRRCLTSFICNTNQVYRS